MIVHVQILATLSRLHTSNSIISTTSFHTLDLFLGLRKFLDFNVLLSTLAVFGIAKGFLRPLNSKGRGLGFVDNFVPEDGRNLLEGESLRLFAAGSVCCRMGRRGKVAKLTSGKRKYASTIMSAEAQAKTM